VTTDRIEKTIVLRAPRDRVWHAITDSKQFGTWVDPAIAKMQEAYAGQKFDCTIDRIEPMQLFSFRWHPFAIDPKLDYSAEPTTLVAFELAEVDGGTRLTITESGFDRIPLERRAKAFEANSGGWQKQTELLSKYLAR